MDPHQIFDKVIEVVEEAASQGLVGYQITGRVEKLRTDLLGDAEAAVEEVEVEASALDAFLERLSKASSHADVNALGAEVGLTLDERDPKVDEKKALVEAAATEQLAPAPETEA